MRRISRTLLVAACTAGLLSTLHSSADAAVPSCFGVPATIVGTAGTDVLTGQAGVVDVIVGRGGNDMIVGGEFYGGGDVPGAAPDLMCGGSGNDRLAGAPGPDRMSGGDGDDYFATNIGADTMLGNAGNDYLDEGSEADNSGTEDDLLRGGGGDDVLITGFGDDRAFGDGGTDRLLDLECGGTRLDGGPGNDTIESYLDSLFGVACSEIAPPASPDRVIGGGGADAAHVDQYDVITGVEIITRS